MAISGGDGSIILTTKVDESGLKKGMQQVNKFAQMSTNEQRRMAQSLSKVYRQQGMSQSEAQKKAWHDLKNNTVATKDLAKATKDVTNETKEYGDTAKTSGTIAKNAVLTVGKAFLTIGVASAAAVVAMTKQAVSAYADYEQLVGGVETLFKDSAEKVVEYANQAFQTAGVSANEYMKQVTSFSASLIQSTAGDTAKAADIANMALIDISDNVNKMGSSMESVTLAYQGFAKQQYMLLDNLKLGYGGTKTEMERLLKDAQALTGVKYDINNLADVYSAIHAIQEQLGITGTTMKEAETTITGSLGMVKSSWQNLLTAMSGGGDLDRAINNFVYSLEKFTANIAPVIERTLLGLGQAIQRTLPMLAQTVVSALVQQIPNLIMAVYNMIVGLFKGIVLGIKALFTGGTAKATEVIKGNISGISSGASSAADNMNNLADATEKAGKQAKKSLAAFDDLNILSSGANDETEAGTVNTSETSMPTGLENATPTTQSGGGMSGLTQEIKENLEALLPIIEIALVAIGLILLAMGNIPWGIGFIIAGAYLYSVTERSGEGGFDLEVIKGDLKKLAEYIEEILIVFGIILLFLGQIGWGIGFIVAGAVIYAVKELQQKEYDTADISTKLAAIMEAVSLSLIGIGIMLIFFGHVPLGLGFIFVGKKLLDISEKKLEEGVVTTKLKKFMQDNSGIIVGVGLALVIIGLICFCFGLLNPITFGIFMAGASVLAAEETMNPGAIQREITNFFQNNAGLIVGVSIALIVLGIILLFTGVGIPLAIGLIVAGGGALATEVALNWNFIVDKVKGVWDKVKEFWNKNIAPIFTIKWWANLGKNIVNGLISGIETGINWIIDALNGFIGGISSITEAIGGLIGQDWEIPEIGHIQIPRLAKGAVIPPNREFLAVLGDQKQGTNIEAPLQTIVDAFNIALAQNGGYSGGNTEVILEIDGREFGRAVVEQGNRENRRIGTRLVIA